MAGEKPEQVGGSGGSTQHPTAWVLQRGPQARPALSLAGSLRLTLPVLSVWLDPQADMQIQALTGNFGGRGLPVGVVFSLYFESYFI